MFTVSNEYQVYYKFNNSTWYYDENLYHEAIELEKECKRLCNTLDFTEYAKKIEAQDEKLINEIVEGIVKYKDYEIDCYNVQLKSKNFICTSKYLQPAIWKLIAVKLQQEQERLRDILKTE